jgi:hypothetical protein
MASAVLDDGAHVPGARPREREPRRPPVRPREDAPTGTDEREPVFARGAGELCSPRTIAGGSGTL